MAHDVAHGGTGSDTPLCPITADSRHRKEPYFEAVTDYQMAEALENRTLILDRWTELRPLAAPLRAKHAKLLARAGA